MDQKSGEQDNSKPKRRTRNDQSNRDFTCGCGKSYLSYPALYTHLKQKHGGKPPQGTLLPNNLGVKANRGRPKIRDENGNQDKDDLQSECSNQPEQTIEDLLSFLDTLGTNFRHQPAKLEQPGEKSRFLLDNFPKDIFQQKTEYESILNHMKDIIQIRESQLTKKVEVVEEEDQEEELPTDPLLLEEVDPGKNIKKTVFNKTLAYFLMDIGPKLSPQAYREICIYVVFLQRGLNELGYTATIKYNQEIRNEENPDIYTKQITMKENEDYCDVENGDQVLLISNEFILALLPKYFQELGEKIEKRLEIFGSTDERLKNAVYVTQHFSYWLYANRFTNSRLQLYTDD